MTELIQKISEYAPRYIMTFVSLVSDPKEFMEQQRRDSKDSKDSLETSLAFFGTSLILFTIFQIPVLVPFVETDFPQVIFYAIGISITMILAVFLYSVALHISWRLVGWRNSIRRFFETETYFWGISLVVIAAFITVSEGLFAFLNPVLYEQLVQTIKAPQSNNSAIEFATGSISLIVPVFVLVIGFLLIIIWYIMAWGNYRRVNGLNEWKSVLAFSFVGLSSIPIAFLLHILQSMFLKIL